MADIESFLVEYEALCKKYKIIVGQYGVLNSVGLSIVEQDSKIEAHIRWLRYELNLK